MNTHPSIPLFANLSHVAEEVRQFKYTEGIPVLARHKNSNMSIPFTLYPTITTYSDYGIVVVTAYDNLGDEYTSAAYSLETWKAMRGEVEIPLISDADSYIYGTLLRRELYILPEKKRGGSW